MTANLVDISNSNTFGNWKDRTNDILDVLRNTVTLGDNQNNNGNVIIEGNDVSSGNLKVQRRLFTDSITPYGDAFDAAPRIVFDGAGETVNANIKIYSHISQYIPVDGNGNSTYQHGSRIYSVNNNVETLQWSVIPSVDLDTLIIEGLNSLGNNVTLNIDKATGIIGGSNLKISNDLLNDNLGDKTINGYVLSTDLTTTLEGYVKKTGDTMSGTLQIISGGNGVILSNTGTITASGDISAFGSISDINRKENIVRIENALDKLSQLGGYTFTYIDNGLESTGVIAQEVEKVLPEAVYETIAPDGTDTKAVRHGNMIGLLIEAINELRREVEQLKEKG